MICLVAMLISACSTCGQKTDPQPQVVTVDTACDWVNPIYLTRHDVQVMDPKTKKAILEHDETWQKICGDVK